MSEASADTKRRREITYAALTFSAGGKTLASVIMWLLL